MRKGIPLRDYHLTQKFDAGIGMSTEPGHVPEYEVREAAVYCNYNMTQWLTLDPGERAACVAQYRQHHRIEANVQDAAERAPKRRER